VKRSGSGHPTSGERDSPFSFGGRRAGMRVLLIKAWDEVHFSPVFGPRFSSPSSTGDWIVRVYFNILTN